MPESRLVVGPLASVSRQLTTLNEGFFNVELLSQSSSATLKKSLKKSLIKVCGHHTKLYATYMTQASEPSGIRA